LAKKRACRLTAYQGHAHVVDNYPQQLGIGIALAGVAAIAGG
jgi:hypothetical protein